MAEQNFPPDDQKVGEGKKRVPWSHPLQTYALKASHEASPPRGSTTSLQHHGLGPKPLNHGFTQPVLTPADDPWQTGGQPPCLHYLI